ncbi:hypothetical protein PRUPE_5G074100 [Prunus persica]|uniref:Uncharacterized protein n=1 Tax=Prunus persica TaxID=3760 RepID=A0A251P544_PRUPE|nr:hypothetical protein PRUPE_5G074100 [Prunus persica]
MVQTNSGSQPVGLQFPPLGYNDIYKKGPSIFGSPVLGVGGSIQAMCKFHIGKYNNNLQFKYRWSTSNCNETFCDKTPHLEVHWVFSLLGG